MNQETPVPSPELLRQLKQFYTELRRILPQVKRIHGEIDRELIFELRRTENLANELSNDVGQRLLPSLDEAIRLAEQLAYEIQYACQQQAPDGTVSLFALQSIEKEIDATNRMLRQFYKELASLQHLQTTLSNDVNKTDKRKRSFTKTLEAFQQEHLAPGEAAQALADEQLTHRDEMDFLTEEIIMLERLQNEINDNRQQFSRRMSELQQALQHYDATHTEVTIALSKSGTVIQHWKQAITTLNSKFAQFDGIELMASDGE